MTTSLNRAQEFHRRIAAALLQEWDPIGVCQEPHAQDEYDSYVHDIHVMLIRHCPVDELFAFLWWVETEHMGLRGDRQRTATFARRLSRIPQEMDMDTQ